MLHRMKLTALVADELLEEVRERAGCRTLTDCVVLALEEWVASKRMLAVTADLRAKPLAFAPGFSATAVRKQTRKSRA